MKYKIKDIQVPKTIEQLISLNKNIVLEDNLINQPLDYQKKYINNICKENNISPVLKSLKK